MHKKWNFPLRISSLNVTKSAVSSGFGHIYWRNSKWKTPFVVQWFCYCVLLLEGFSMVVVHLTLFKYFFSRGSLTFNWVFCFLTFWNFLTFCSNHRDPCCNLFVIIFGNFHGHTQSPSKALLLRQNWGTVLAQYQVVVFP